MFESIFPNQFLYFEKMIKWLFNFFLPKTRPQDDVKINADTPHEHEFAIANICSVSPSFLFYFPLNTEFYRRYAILKNLSQNQINKIKYYTEYTIKNSI